MGQVSASRRSSAAGRFGLAPWRRLGRFRRGRGGCVLARPALDLGGAASSLPARLRLVRSGGASSAASAGACLGRFGPRRRSACAAQRMPVTRPPRRASRADRAARGPLVRLLRQVWAVSPIIADAPRPPADRCSQRSSDAEQAHPVGPADLRLGRALRVRHEPQHVAALVHDPRDPALRPVRVGRPASRRPAHRHSEGRRARSPRASSRVAGIGDVSALAMADRQADASRRRTRSPSQAGHASGRSTRSALPVAAELEMIVAQQRAGQQPRLGQDLEPVAGADHRPAGRGEGLDGAHHRREARDGAGPQVVAVREPAGQNHGVRPPEVGLGVPHQAVLPAEHLGRHVREVALAPGAGKDHHRDARAATPTTVTRRHHSAMPACSSARSSQLAVSITGFASRRRHISATAASACCMVGGRRRRCASACRCGPRSPVVARASAARTRSSAPPGRRCPHRSATWTSASPAHGQSDPSHGRPVRRS